MISSSSEENFQISQRNIRSLDYGIQKERIYHLFPTEMHIGKVALMTNEAPVEKRSTWVSVGTWANPGFNSTTTHQQKPNYRPF
jgi:hypothetical protein